ncbi:hypothetical protein SMC26_15550 [Actinomadura fulvescens]|uniref:Uncharacterized protein n=1 Tax=Actinomadura fulvescens TaxID=46160 RepID=A0ABN3QLM6_9ACTN
MGKNVPLMALASLALIPALSVPAQAQASHHATSTTATSSAATDVKPAASAAQNAAIQGWKPIKVSYKDGWTVGKVHNQKTRHARVEGIVYDKNCKAYGGSRVKISRQQPGSDPVWWSKTACNNGRGFGLDIGLGDWVGGLKVQVCSTRPKKCGPVQFFKHR